MLGAIEHYKHVLYEDPPLSEYGIEKSKQALNNLDKQCFDIVMSSTMLRAIETAIYMYVKDKNCKSQVVYPVPFIKESALGLDNKISETLQKQKKALGDEKRFVDYRFVETADEPAKWRSNANDIDFNKFLSWLAKHINVLKELAGKPDADELDIAIVTHSHLMKKVFRDSDCSSDIGKKPFNNGVIKASIEVSAHGGNAHLLDCKLCSFTNSDCNKEHCQTNKDRIEIKFTGYPVDENVKEDFKENAASYAGRCRKGLFKK